MANHRLKSVLGQKTRHPAIMSILGNTLFFIMYESNQSITTETLRWEAGARDGIYMVHSPLYTGNVSLVLNL